MLSEQKLNPAQQEAIEYTEGPLLILAGAGSGKTRTLTHRIAHLISEKSVSPQNILAVTFTNKAAGEMRSRVLKLLGRNQDDRNFLPFLGTFHSVCVRILRTEAKNLGFSSSFVIFDDSDSLSAVKQSMRQLQISEKQYSPRLLKNLISSAKNELIGTDEYKNMASGPAQEAAAKVYGLYQHILREAQAFDFDDLLLETVSIFNKHQEVLKRWQERFHYILIDEYQDTNAVQYQFAKLLAAKHKNICVVGDDWQSIYSWRGANFRNILDFEKDYPNTKVVKLEQNYRSTKQILEAAQKVIHANRNRSDKELWTDNARGSKVAVHQTASEVQEAELVVKSIEDARTSGRHYWDFAVLYRTNAQSRSLEEAFIRYGIPYKVVGGVRFYERKEVKDMLAYLRLVTQPEDVVSFRRIVNVPTRGLGETSLEKFLNWRREYALPLSQALEKAREIPGLTPRATNSLINFSQLIRGLRKDAERLNLPDLIELISKRTGYMDFLNDGSIPAAERIENVQELVSVASEYESVGANGFLEEVALIADVDSYDTTADAVTLMTLHAAKGLEFPVVFLVGLEEGVFPHSGSFMDPDQMEEERRLMYVGMTRAMEELHLVHASSRMLYGRTMHNPPARFVAEISDNSQVVSEPTIAFGGVTNQPEMPKVTVVEGDSVRHPTFGNGIVVTVEEDVVTVAFSKIGTKQLSAAYAPLERI